MHRTKLFFILILAAGAVFGEDYDDEVIDTLKIEANHDVERLKSFKKEIQNNKVFENEREKGLGEYLEDQEKWDLIRERGLREYKKQKNQSANLDEKSEEYLKDRQEKEEALERYEKGRELHVRTRNKIRRQQPRSLSILEEEELQIFEDRPRFDVRKKRKNKWATTPGKAGPGSGGSASGFQGNTAPSANDFASPPPPPDFPLAPAPYEGFEELPPPPIYDSNMNTSVPYDPAFGGEMAIPPPPPPPPDYNF